MLCVIAVTVLAGKLKMFSFFRRTPVFHKYQFIFKVIQPHPLHNKFIVIIKKNESVLCVSSTSKMF